MVYYAGFAERGNEQKANDINKSWHLLLIGLGSVLVLLVLFIFEDDILRFVEVLDVIHKFGDMKLPYVQ